MRAIAALARPRPEHAWPWSRCEAGSSSSWAGWFEPVVTEPDIVSGVPSVAVQAVPGRAVMAGAGSHVLRRAAFLDDQQVGRTVARGLAGLAGGRRWCRFWRF